MLYSRIQFGWVEQIYDFKGNCIAQKFVPDETHPIERRVFREKSDGPQRPDEPEHDQLIEHPEDIALIESKERFCEAVLVQPAEQGITST